MPLKKTFLLLVLSIICFSTRTQGTETELFREIKRPYKTISPCISKMFNLDKKALTMEVQHFWVSAKQKGLPLIEKDSLDPEYVYITIAYRENKNKDITLDVYGIYDETRLGNRKMRRLKNTDIYYRCYKVPKDICFSYRFIIKDSLWGKEHKDLDTFNPEVIPKEKINRSSYSVLDLRKNEPDWNKKKFHNLNSRVETFKYTDKILNKERNIYVYLPPDYQKNRKEPYTVIYLFDAFIYQNRVEVPNILDNLITQGKIAPMIAVLFSTYKNSRDMVLPLNFKFKDEFISNFLPIIRQKYHTSIKPGDNIIGGISYGGLAAAFIGFYHPEIFGKVLSQSGSFWRGLKLTDDQGKWIRMDWLINKYLTEEKKNLTLFLDWGLQENWVLGSNRRMVKALRKKGYEYKFIEFNGWHDWSNSRKTFPLGLMYLLGQN